MITVMDNQAMAQQKLTGMTIFGVRIAVDSEEKLRHYLIQNIRLNRHLKISPIKMGEILKIIFSPSGRKFYRKFDLAYPDSWFTSQCLFRYNHNFREEKRIFTHRLILDLIEITFKEKLPLVFVGFNENQKNNLKKKLNYLFPEAGDICFLHPDMVRYRPDAVITWLNKSNYGLTIVHAHHKLRHLLLNQLQQGFLFLDNVHLNRYRKEWRKKPKWFSFRSLRAIINRTVIFFSIFSKIILGCLILYYPFKIFFSLCFWLFSFIINKARKDLTITIDFKR